MTPEEKAIYMAEWRARHPGYGKRWQEQNRTKMAGYRRAHRQRSQTHRFVESIRRGTRRALAAQGVTKVGHTADFLGCSPTELQAWLASRFNDGMTFENHGVVWDIDHIIPCSAWDLSRPDHIRAVFHWTNLQPMLKVENRWVKSGANRRPAGFYDAAIAERLMVLLALG